MELKEMNIFGADSSIYKSHLMSITRTEPHYHDDSLELVYCLEGEVQIVAGMQQAHLHEGDIFSIDCEDIHYLYSDVENKVLITNLNLHCFDLPYDFLKNMFFACESQHCHYYQLAALTRVKDILLSMALIDFEKRKQAGDASFDMNLMTQELMDTLYTYFNYYTYDNPNDYMNPELFDRFNRMIIFCLENYKGKLTAARIAEHTHISERYLSQYLRNTPFKNLSSMIKDVRCFKAERLLLTTDMSNVDIAFACGFSDPKYFYSAFKDWWGCSPHVHRSNYEKYMKQDERCLHYPARVAAETVKEKIIVWHMKKTSRQSD